MAGSHQGRRTRRTYAAFMAQHKWFLYTLLFFTLVHFLYSGIYMPMFVLSGDERLGHIREESEPLRKFVQESIPIEITNPRQYGPVFFFVMYPLLRFVPTAQLGHAALVLTYLFAALAFFFTYKALFRNKKEKRLGLFLLAILWFNFSSLYYIMAVKNVEMWELFLLALALFGLVESRRVIAGFAVAAATLIKLIPGFFLFYYLISRRKVFFYGICSLFGIMLLSHLAFGPDMGLLYLPHVVASGASTESWGAAHFENNAIKGIVYKFASGWELDPAYPYIFVLSPGAQKMAFILSTMLQISLLALVVWLLWTRRKKNRHLEEFGLVSAAMLLLSPQSALEYSTLLLVAFSIGMYCILFQMRAQTTKKEIALFSGAYLLLGHFIPFSLFLKLPPFLFLKQLFDFPSLGLSEVYKAVGFPFLGYVLLFAFFASLLWRAGKEKAEKHKGQAA